ncbi:MAG: glycosyl hydrolase family 28-related protein, partial [Thermomicrobiales bacterium]
MTPRTLTTSIAGGLAALCVWAINLSDAKAACVVNVNDRGAIANDAISDSTAIQNAIAAAQAAGGGDVCFGPGRYRLSAAIQWTVGSAYKPIGIVGVPGATILSPDASGNSAIVVAGVPFGAGGV